MDLFFLQELEKLPEQAKKEKIQAAWFQLDRTERFIFNKLITGGFRIGVSQSLMSQALAKVLQLDKSNIAHA